MAAVFFTADTHFTHRMVAGLRGFASSDEHDAEIVARWNATVSPDDTVWHLGDVGLGKAALILPWADQLNGTKHLITGNHDAVWPGHRDAHRHQREWLAHFASVQAFARRRMAGRSVLLSHMPYSGDHTGEDRHSQYRLRDEGLWLLHGHTHSSEKLSGGRQVCVGLDAWGLRPAPLGEVERMIAAAGARETASA